MSRPLFKGDISAPLSAEEIKDFMGRFSVDLDLPARERQRYATQMGLPANSSEEAVAQAFLSQCIATANKTVTGRMQMRKLMQNNDERFNITFGTKSNSFAGIYYTQNDHIHINKILLDNPEELTSTLLHECTHDSQNMSEEGIIYTLTDMETQAFSFQMSTELNTIKKSGRYESFYQECQKKWLHIAQNPAQTPRGLPKFEPVPGLSAKEMTEARTRYANQMASLETQAAIMLDFTGDEKCPIPKQTMGNRIIDLLKIIRENRNETAEERATYQAAVKELASLAGGNAAGDVSAKYTEQDLKGFIIDPIGGRVDENLVKKMQAENPFVTDAHFNKIREIESIHINREKGWKLLNETIDLLPGFSQTDLPKENPFENIEEPSPSVVPTNETNAMAQTNQTLESSSQNITQEKTDDMLIINQQNASQRMG